MRFAPATALTLWRNRLLPMAAAFGLAGVMPDSLAASPAPVFAYVGSYSPNGQGVYLVQQDPHTGVLEQVGVFASVPNPAQLAASGNTLFVGSESNHFEGSKFGGVAAYAIDRSSGALTLRNQVNAQGAGTVYLALTPDQRHLLAANYISGSIVQMSVNGDGSLGAVTDLQQSAGEPGAGRPAAAVEGSFAISDHNGPHAHMVAADASGRFAFSTDLGLDRIYQWKLDSVNGKYVANDPPFIAASSAGAGPRHFAFHPDGKDVYLVNEEASTLTHYQFDSNKGTLTEAGSISTLPPEYKGTAFASDLIVSPDGRYVYVLNRLHDTVARIGLAADGGMRWLDETWTRGSYPRTLSLDPAGRFMYITNQRSDQVTTFKVAADGQIEFANQYLPIPAPCQLLFLK